ncbi:MAG: NUDIX hydrolase [Acidimicrobiales bacterium]
MDIGDDREPVFLRVATAVFRADTVLLCRRLDDPEPTWVLPGGTPRPGERAAACARREILEETGLHIDPERVAFVFETTSPNGRYHLMEIVFMAWHRDARAVPAGRETHLEAEFVPLDTLASINLLPPIAGYLRGLARQMSRLPEPALATAAYLGNVWRSPGTVSSAVGDGQ